MTSTPQSRVAPASLPEPERRGSALSFNRAIRSFVEKRFFRNLISRTGNFSRTKWLGIHIRQNVMDLWTIQETIAELKPDVIVETGTLEGGSSLFYAHLFDLMGTAGKILTIDIQKQHNVSHPRVTYLVGSSTDAGTIEQVRKFVAGAKTVLVILDSDHHREHVKKELDLYAEFVTPGSYMLCQDGVMDVMPKLRYPDGDGPLPAIQDFVKEHPEFQVDHERCERFILTHHPMGWLYRKPV